MCGISGILRFDGKPVDRQRLTMMNTLLAHRGPDDEGFFFSDSIGLGHRRLTIIDRSGGHQPIVSEDEAIAITYNGEIYNYVELRDRLSSHYQFTSHSDTEVLLRAYQHWGIDCLEHLRGMFAFAVVDKTKGKAYLIRDRMGIKPLYYSVDPHRLAFASELAPLVAAGLTAREISDEAIAGYLLYQYVPTPLTIYRDTYKLEPAHYLTIDLRSGVKEKRRYWNLSDTVVSAGYDKALEGLNTLLDETVSIYCRSDVKFGSFLSGGVDSSLVTALMGRVLSNQVSAFSIGFQERKYSELPFAEQAAEIVSAKFCSQVVTPTISADLLRKMVWHFGEPFADSSAYPTWHVSALAAQQVKMILSGDGGDEVFAGYPLYAILEQHQSTPSTLRRSFFSALGHLPPLSPYLKRIREGAKRRTIDADTLFEYNRHINHVDVMDRMLSIQNPWLQHPLYERFSPGFSDPITNYQAIDLVAYMTEDILTKVDRMSMAHSIEVRVPLLDHKVVEYGFSLPRAYKLRPEASVGEAQGKAILKSSAERFYSTNFLNRKKMGFGIPRDEWLRTELRPMLEEMILNRHHPIYEWLDFDYVTTQLQAYLGDGQRPTARYQGLHFWSLLMLGLWYETVHAPQAVDSLAIG